MGVKFGGCQTYGSATAKTQDVEKVETIEKREKNPVLWA
jgi:hypothetical protein